MGKANTVTENTIIEKKETIWNKEFISIFIVNIFMSMGQFMMNTLLPKYTDSLGATAAIVGVVSSMFAVTALGIRPFAGPAMDYFRKNRLLSATIALITVSFVCYGFAKTIPMIIVARLIHGMGIGVAVPLCLALASNSLPNGKMASGIGIFSLAQAIATAVGPTIGLNLVGVIGYNGTFFVCSALMCFSFVLTLFLKCDAPERTERFKISLKSVIAPEALIPAAIMFFLFGGYSCINYFIVIYGGLRGVEDISLFFTAYAVCMLFSRPFSGRLADRFGVDKTIIPGILVFALPFFIISFAHTLTTFLIAGAISAFGFGFCEPSIQTMCMQLVPKERRGAAGNTNFMGIDFGNLIGPALAGLLITGVQKHTGDLLLGYSVMYRVMVVSVFIALAVFMANRKKLMSGMRAAIENSESQNSEK